MPTFAELGVPDDLCDALDARGASQAFPIQTATIPAALSGQDICGRAPTGSGKTFAFGIPLLATVERARPKRPRGLVLVPTRELAAQVADDLAWMGAGRGIRVQAFYGGVRFESQIKALRQGVDIAVACPGRLVDLVNQGILRLDGVDRVVIDEADRMADMGFLPEVKRIVDQTADDRQTWLFSATLDGDVDELVTRYQNDPFFADVTPDTPRVELTHYHWLVKHPDRIATTASIIARVGPTIVFTRTRHGADRAAKQLGQAGIAAAAIHGNRSQSQRQRALGEFASGQVRALVATDVAARGIHIDDVACVVHFDLPEDHKDYVHRSGRTGRAGSTGVVVALVMPDKRRSAKQLARTLGLDVTIDEVDVDLLPEAPPPVKRARPKYARPREQDGSKNPRSRGQDRSRHDKSSRPDRAKRSERPSEKAKAKSRPKQRFDEIRYEFDTDARPSRSTSRPAGAPKRNASAKKNQHRNTGTRWDDERRDGRRKSEDSRADGSRSTQRHRVDGVRRDDEKPRGRSERSGSQSRTKSPPNADFPRSRPKKKNTAKSGAKSMSKSRKPSSRPPARTGRPKRRGSESLERSE